MEAYGNGLKVEAVILFNKRLTINKYGKHTVLYRRRIAEAQR
ncbi:hypothetical protein Cycma_1022 [Cyclobacterium marinum DSM 745]|uniref:Uncharacterized protein n=1 Tax=Cyclobacterium marinum (strain ATCC 25205 / DSM 745 / LMG 13164 / NCIMB 1802) TaxID=880070 RepID=G0IVM7_CYCMS|nr:hypothetical protein Cycma_1022 [Cyclobacterium marinum DSM 745]